MSDISSSPELPITAVSLNDEGEYYCTVTNTLVTGLAISSTMFTVIPIDVTPATFKEGYPEAANITDTSVDLMVQIEEPADCYFAVLKADEPDPSVEQVRNGTDGTGTGLPLNLHGTIVIPNPAAEGLVTIENLEVETDYEIFLVTLDTVGNISSDVTVIAFSTTKTIVGLEPLSASKVIAFPNPVTDVLSLITAENRPVECRLFNQNGKEINPEYFHPSPGIYLIDFGNLKKSVYILVVRDGRDISHIRIVRN